MNTTRKFMTLGVVTTSVLALTIAGTGVASASSGPGNGHQSDTLISNGTVSVAQMAAFKAALKVQALTVRTGMLDSALVILGANGTLTTAQVTSVKAAFSEHGIRNLVHSGILTLEQAKAIKDGMHTQEQRAEAATLASALTPLVANGTLTEAQATAVKSGGKHAVKDMMHAGSLTGVQVKAIKDSLKATVKAERLAIVKTVLAKMVADGVITSAQADAILAEKVNPKRLEYSNKVY